MNVLHATLGYCFAHDTWILLCTRRFNLLKKLKGDEFALKNALQLIRNGLGNAPTPT